MASEIKVDTISEKTSANGVSIDSVVHKDSAVYPSSADGGALGSASNEWSDLFLADSSVIKFGADQDTTLTHTDGTGLTLNSTNKLCFNDASQFVQGSSATVLSLGATDEIDLTATAVDLNGTLDVSGTTTLGGTVTVNAGAVFNEASADVNFRIEDNNNANAFFVEGGASAGQPLIGIGTGSPEGEIHTMCSGIGQSLFDSYDGNTGELALRTSRNATVGSHSASNSGDGGRLKLYVSDGNSFEEAARIEMTADANAADGDVPGRISFYTTPDGSSTVSERMRIDSAGEIATGGETAPDVAAGGICIDTNAASTFALTFKNSDVAHGITTQAETDTHMRMSRYDANGGGAQVGYSESTIGLYFQGIVTTANTAKSTSSVAPMYFRANIKSGTDGANMSSNGNLFAVANGGNAAFVVDAEGELHSDGGAQSAYDEYDDAQLIRACDLSRGKGTIDSKFDKFIAYNHEHLADLKLVGREDDGTPNHFINVTGMQRLHNGAIWQQYEKHERLLEAVYDLAKEAVGEEKANAILEKHEVKRLQ